MGILHDGALVFDTSINTLGFKKGLANLTTLAKGGTAAITALTASITALETAGVKYNAQIESYETSFKVMTGSAEKAAQTIETLRVMAAKTPFELRDLADATQLLINYGFSADDAVEKMSMLGDISQGSTEKLHRIALAYGQMTSANKVLLVDTKQMIEAGFNPLQEIAETTGESMNSLYDRISKGTISVDEITASMQRSTSEGGKYFQSMEEQSKTVAGQFSTLKDNWNSFTGAMAESTSETLGNDVLPELNKALEESAELVSSGAFQGVNDFVKSAGSFVADIIPKAVSGLNSVAEHIDVIKASVVSLGTAYASYKAASSIANTAIALDKHSTSIATALTEYEIAVGKLNTGSKNYGENLSKLTGNLTTTQLAVGALTGQVEIAAAKQALLNKTVSFFKSPTGIGLMISGITALVSWLITLSQNADTASNRIKKLSEQSQELKKSYDETVASIEKNAQAATAEAETAKVLRDRLFDLDKQLKDNTKTEEEAELVREDLNATADQLNQIIPDIIDNIYDENGAYYLQKDAVDSLVNSYYDLAYAKAMASAYQEKMNTAAKAIADERETQKDIEKEKTTAEDSYVSANKTLEEIEKKGHYWGAGIDKLVQQVKAGYASEDIKKANDALADGKRNILDYKEDIKEWSKLKAEFDEDILNLENLFKKPKSSGGGGSSSTSGGAIAKQQTDEIKKEFEKQYKLLNKALEREEISHAEYYKALKDLRDKYFTEGSDEWEKYTEELGDFAYDTFDDCLDRLEDFKNESLDKINELKDEQQQLKESLMPDKSSFEYGTINGEKFTSLANYDKEINQARQYGTMLDALFEKRADIPQSVIDEIKGMDTEQAMKYMEALLNSSDSQFNAFIESRKKLEEAVSENSAKLMSSEMEEMKRILEEKFGELPEDFFDLGDESGSAFGEAFLAELDTAMAAVRNSIMSQMDAIATEANLKLRSSISAGGGIYTTTNNYNSSYTIGSSKQTVTEQLQAARNAATLERMRGGYDK